jgi:hypothetical protein
MLLVIVTTILIVGFHIKSKINSNNIQNSYTPPTYNLTSNQLNEINEILDGESIIPHKRKIDELDDEGYEADESNENSSDSDQTLVDDEIMLISQEELDEMENRLDRGELLDQKSITRLQSQLEIIMSPEQFQAFNDELLEIQQDGLRRLEDLLSNASNSGLDYNTILEIIDFIINLF